LAAVALLESQAMASQNEDLRTAPELALEAGRADTLSQADPYRLQLADGALGKLSPHFAIGFLVGAVTVPEPLSFADCLEQLSGHASDVDVGDEELDDDGAEDEGPEEASTSSLAESSVRALYEQVSQRIADGAVPSLVPIAEDTAACDAWLSGLRSVTSQSLHDLTDEEGRVALRVFAEYDGDERVTRAQRKERARTSLAADVTRLIELWSEVPPYDPEQDALRWSKVVPKPAATEPKDRVIHAGGTFVRAEPKVGRNDLCPCGSGKKFKKCCG
jgi:hypothetical protein